MARCARSPELRGDSDRLGVARVRTRATTPGLSPPCWFRARAIDEQRSVARPSGCWWLAACDIHMLPLTSKIKDETQTPIFYSVGPHCLETRSAERPSLGLRMLVSTF